MLYFAYGSNMSAERLVARVTNAGVRGHALLTDHALYCDKRGADGSGKFTIAPQKNEQVHGVLFELQSDARQILDGFEGPGYLAKEIEVDVANQSFTALTYQALPEYRDSRLLPFGWYLAFAIAGARQHALPQYWIEQFEAWPNQTDPITERDQLNRAILKQASEYFSRD
ncbi:MAG: gamma-glutamylcyclotransferase family protein [Salinisphaeraceae bacterium]|nr:gamma-glutamylcyclotransferase family protein [Salinisphaeraceae bacterium]